jgi:tetratricopeptide (TPR) repeat protein
MQAIGHRLSRGAVNSNARRALLNCAKQPAAFQPLVDAAELLIGSGFEEAGQLLCNVAFIRVGFSQTQIVRQSAIETAIGINARTVVRSPAPRRAGHRVELAVADLTRLIDMVDEAPRGPSEHGGVQATVADGGEMGGVGDEPFRRLLRLSARARKALEASPGEAAWTELAEVMPVLLRAAAETNRGDIQTRFEDSIPDLAADVAARGLRGFIAQDVQLSYMQLGSVRLLQAAAQLDEEGLGPYFAGVQRLLREARDLISLVRSGLRKSAKSDLAPARFSFWVTALSARLSDEWLAALIDDLADEGHLEAVRQVFARRMRVDERRIAKSVFWRARDIGLDFCDFDLALMAQEHLTSIWPELAREWMILGDLQATVGRPKDALKAFQRSLSIKPKDREAEAHLAAAREGALDQLAVTCSYDTSNARRALRKMLVSTDQIGSSESNAKYA